MTTERRFLTTPELASRWGIQPQTLRKWMVQEDRRPHGLPTPARFGRAVRWPLDAIERFERTEALAGTVD